ncbi:MAG: acyltransferase [Nevskiaceae bacterium]|nr:MAG: acyltransferase [Nevskiaceae bacterium]TBR74864.1 MAG: acyltransferase [Nevskiaceae bacterium]
MKYVPRFAKRLVKALIYRPYGVRMGPDSLVMRPRWLHNRSRISMGARCSVGRFAIWNPLASYRDSPQNGEIKLGDDVYVGGFSQLHAMSTLEIGDGCVLSEHVYMSDIAHGLDPNAGLIMQQPLESKGSVTLGRYVFLGFGVSVMPGVTLGDRCIVGARSVVTRSFPAYSMIAGSPARLIKVFDHQAGKWVPAPRS